MSTKLQFYFCHTRSCQRVWGVPKERANKTNKNGHMTTFQSGEGGPKGSEMVNLDVFDNFEPFWAHLDTFGPFQTKINLLPHKDKVGFGGGAFEQ